MHSEWIDRDGTRVGITGAFGVPRENDNDRRVVEFCAERGCVWVTHILSTDFCINTHEWQWVKTERDKDHDKSGKEGYDAGCEGGRDKDSQTTMLYCVNSG